MIDIGLEIFNLEPSMEGPRGWIQYCKCGHHGHCDADFFYYYECPKCKTKYRVGSFVKLFELNEKQAMYVGDNFETPEPDPFEDLIND